MQKVKEYTAFLSLLRSGLWEKDLLDLSSFPLSKEQWLELYTEACRQTVQGIIYRGLDYLPSPLLPPQELLLRWVVESVRLEKNNKRTNEEIISLSKFFVSNGINPILKKGQAAAALYEKPYLRVCGDIDLYFQTEKEYKRANALIKGQKIQMHRRPDGSCEYNWHGIEVEHHVTLMYLRNPFLSPFLRRLEREEQFDVMSFLEDSSYKIPIPSLPVNLLMFNTHIMKHAFISGIGLRQLCDMARAYYKFNGLYKGEELRLIYKKTGIMKWSRLLHSFLTEYLGLEKKYLPYVEDTVSSEILFKEIMSGGNFGQYAVDQKENERHYLSKKRNTVKAIYRNRRISMDYALFESFCWTVHLIYGQINES